ncbi:MAG: 3-phosphoshikimate 1-carboxyvinyltransferase [Bacteroidota bacterium]
MIDNRTAFVVELPRSKSLSNRWLLLSKLSGDRIRLSGLSDSSDTVHLKRLLGHTGPVFDAGDGGTTFRFLLAYLSMISGQHQLAGTGRITDRPVEELVDALLALGAEIEYTGVHGRPPLAIQGGHITGGRIDVDASRSSQFVSALLLIAPFLRDGLELTIKDGKTVSRPYISMTLKVLSAAGVEFHSSAEAIMISPQSVQSCHIEIERDWSSAAFFYQLAALLPSCTIHFSGLFRSGLQGDEKVADLFYRMGVQTADTVDGIVIRSPDHFPVLSGLLDFDLNDTPDLAPSILMACLGRRINCRLHGIAHLRYKESDRIKALLELVHLSGGDAEIDHDSLILSRFPEKFMPLIVDPLGDHRIAMSAAIFSATRTPVTVLDPDVVNKSFPGFWNSIAAFDLPVTVRTKSC